MFRFQVSGWHETDGRTNRQAYRVMWPLWGGPHKIYTKHTYKLVQLGSSKCQRKHRQLSAATENRNHSNIQTSSIRYRDRDWTTVACVSLAN